MLGINLSREKKFAPATFEGTPGIYTKRESPPDIPSTLGSSAKPKSNLVKSSTPRSLSGSRMLNVSSTPNINASQLSVNSGHHSTIVNVNSQIISCSRRVDVPERRLSNAHNRRQAGRPQLSSHSFNIPPQSSTSTSKSQGALHTLKSLSEGTTYTNSIQTETTRRPSTRSVQSMRATTTAGNAESLTVLNRYKRMDLNQLPHGWDVELTSDGIRYYVDHNNKRTHWIHPLAPENLTLGWTKIFDQVQGVIYYNEAEKRTQFEHPGIASSVQTVISTEHNLFPASDQATNVATKSTTTIVVPNENRTESSLDVSVTPDSINNGNQQVTEDYLLHIIDYNDVPEWLRLYSESDFSSDHLLNFSLFKLPQLQEFDQKLLKLYKQAVINTVVKFEGPRREINQELTRRRVNL